MSELEVPDEACEQLAAQHSLFNIMHDEWRGMVRVVATPVVVAELRAQAEKLERFAAETSGVMHYTYGGVADQLRERIKDLDPRELRFGPWRQATT